MTGAGRGSMGAVGHGRNGLRRVFGRFARAQGGGPAVEFALMLVPFFGLLGGIIQFAFIIWAGQNLDQMVQRAVRNLFTGSFQNANMGQTDTATLLSNLKATMCQSGGAAMVTVFPCSALKLNVSVSSSFANGSQLNAYDSTSRSISTSFEGYTCARAREIVIVSAVVPLPTFFKLLNPGILLMADGSYLLQSTAVFRTEPYSAPSAVCS